MSITKSQDFYGWTQEQAALLRAGRWSETDLAQLAEEIENMGRSEWRELESRLKVLLVHLLKWRFQPSHRGRSRELTIKEQRRAVFHVLKANPSLEPRLDEVLADAYELAILGAARETGLDEGAFPERCPWSIEAVLNPEFLPGN
ncbi:MAG TPA: DUF29 domain-containing protein [Methylococcus sp.]|nr:DUF29 domain-containing protein [Methylococcus sp.]